MKELLFFSKDKTLVGMSKIHYWLLTTFREKDGFLNNIEQVICGNMYVLLNDTFDYFISNACNFTYV